MFPFWLQSLLFFDGRAESHAVILTASCAARRICYTLRPQVVEHTDFGNPSERDLFPREFARV